MIDARRLAVVVAHPDDETVGCGALLSRLRGVGVVVITDGSPHDLADARIAGCGSREEYAACRAAELTAALAIAGISNDQIAQFGIRDQRAAFHLQEIADRLASYCARLEIALVLTHAYEGGHPDHDATAFAVRRAAKALSCELTVMEMPFYRLGAGGEERQSFAMAEDADPATIVALQPAERARKLAMRDAHRTQARVLAGFGMECEQFRVAPDYDFLRLPNGGRLLYELYNWGLSGSEWLACVRKADPAT